MESILLQGSKLNIGDSMWLAWDCPLVICQSQDSNSVCLTPEYFLFVFFFFKSVNFDCTGSSLLCEGFLHLLRTGLLFIAVWGLSLRWLLLLQSTGSRMWASVFVAPGLSCSKACKIFPDRDQTCVPCIGRQILNHWTTREVLDHLLLTTALCCLDCQAKTRPLFADNPHSNSNDLIFCS